MPVDDGVLREIFYINKNNADEGQADQILIIIIIYKSQEYCKVYAAVAANGDIFRAHAGQKRRGINISVREEEKGVFSGDNDADAAGK